MMHCIKNVNIKMKLFENRLLYSFYCFEVWSNNLADKLFSSLMNKAYELTYKWDPFILINKEKTTLEEYIAWRKRISKNVVYNLDYGQWLPGAKQGRLLATCSL